MTIATALIFPPDLLELNERLGALPLGLDFDLPASRKIGGWLALFASLGIVGSTLLAAREPDQSGRRHRLITPRAVLEAKRAATKRRTSTWP